jgi:transcriptional regulator with XRE-family HTH domain
MLVSLGKPSEWGVITHMAFHERLKSLRDAAGLSQEALARAAGISTSAVTKLEQSGKEPSWNTAKKLAKALGVSLDDLAVDEQTATLSEPTSANKGRRKKGV